MKYTNDYSHVDLSQPSETVIATVKRFGKDFELTAGDVSMAKMLDMDAETCMMARQPLPTGFFQTK